jgi:serine/threonine protein kinase
MNSDWLASGADSDTGTDWVLGGRYRLISPVGAGGMAVVWQAYDNVLARTVAVKILAAQYAEEPQSRDRIRREAQAAAVLSHPNIAQVYDYGEAEVAGEVIPYVVMELIRGGTLHQRLSDGPVLPRYAMRVCAEIAAALAAAHAEGLAHRDIKPANVMLAPTGAKVVDFGLAAAIRPPGSGSADFEVLGTPAYLAPERLLHDAVEPASDVYALGVLLYRLLAGHSPWTTETTTQMLTAHIYLEPAPLLPVFQVPHYVTALCNRCLSKDPAQRPSAREAAALLAHGAGLQVITDEPPARGQTAIDPDASILIRAAADQHPSQTDAAALIVAQPLHPDHAPSTATQLSPPDDAARNHQQPSCPDTSPATLRPPPESATLAELPPSRPDDDALDRAPAERLTARSQPADAEPVVVPSDPGREASAPAAGRRNRTVYALAATALLAAVAATLGILRLTHQEATVSAPAPGSGPASAASRAAESPVPGTSTVTAPSGLGLSPTGAINTTAVDPTRGPTAPGNQAVTASTAATAVPHPTLTTTAPAAEPSVRTLSSAGGSVRATCPATDTAQILSWTATKPYKVAQGDKQAGPSPAVSFKHGNTQVTMTVTCNGAVPSANST